MENQSKTQIQNRIFSLNGESGDLKQQELIDYFNRSSDTFQNIFKLIQANDSFYVKAQPLRHPLIFYLGHTFVFLVNKLFFNGYLEERVNPKFESMMAAGVDEMDWDDLDSNHYDWPKVEEVLEYRAQVRKIITQKINTLSALPLPIKTSNQLVWLITLAIEYQNLHLQTVAAILRKLPVENLVHDAALFPVCSTKFFSGYTDGSANIKHSQKAFPLNTVISVESGSVDLVHKDENTFAWDNQLGISRKFEVEAFKVSKFLVSNYQFNEFIVQGGYTTEALWTEEGWKWLQANRTQDSLHPVYWVNQKVGDKSEYQYRTLTSIIDMPWDWPVETNFHESKAFCNWKSKQSGTAIRLPSETEYQLISERAGDLSNKKANISLQGWASSCPIDTFEFTGGVFDLIGNVAQHTESTFDGFEGFKPYSGYDDFSAPKFDMKHNIIKGGSWAWTGARLTQTYRHCLRRHFNEFVGIRYVVSEKSVVNEKKIYETDDLASMYLQLNYGTTDYYGVPNWPKRCADICLQVCRAEQIPMKKALDIGCAVGRTPFELAAQFQEVVGGDLSARFFQLAVKLRNYGVLKYFRGEEGEIVSEQVIDLKTFKFAPFIERTQFIQQDALNMDLKKLNNFNLIFAGNLIDRVKQPRDFLATIHEYLADGGIFVNASPYTWLRDYSDKEDWVGGFTKDGVDYGTYEGIQQILSSNFEEIQAPMNVEFVIRETRRQFQHTQSHFTFWRKISQKN